MSLVEQFYNALGLSAIYISIAIGITLIYGLTRVVNFAHGQLLTIGSFTTFALVDRGVPYLLAIITAVLLTSCIGLLLDLGLFRRTLGNPLNGFVISLGLIVALEALVVVIFSGDLYRVPAPFDGVTVIGSLHLDHPRLFVIAVCVALTVATFVLLDVTKIGRGIRALAERPTAARLVGVPVSFYISVTWVVASASAALAGGLVATIAPFDAYSGFDYVLKGFAVAIIGGLGSVRGAVVAGLLLAVADTAGAAYVSLSWAPAFGLAATALLILVRPNGLFRGAGTGDVGHFNLGANEMLVRARQAVLDAAAQPQRHGSTAWTRLASFSHLSTLAIVAGIVLVPVLGLDARSMSVATYAVILAIAAYAFWFPLHHAGIFSIASAAMMGAGGYTAAVALTRWDLGFWAQVLLAVAVSAALAFVMGLIALRTTASHFVILTLVLSQIVTLVLINWKSVTNGHLGIVALTPPRLAGITFADANRFYLLAVAFLFLTAVLLWFIGNSRFASRLHAIRENEQVARAVGIHVLREKLIAFVVFGSISGVAGVLLFYYLRFVDPTTYSVTLSIYVPLMVLLGGVSVRVGPVVGAALFASIPELLDLSPALTALVYGLVMIAVIVLFPMGLGGIARSAVTSVRWRRYLHRHPSPPAETSEPRRAATLGGRSG